MDIETQYCFLSSFIKIQYSMNFTEEKSNMFQSGREKNMKHELGRGYLVLAFCQVSSNSVQQLQGYQKCLSQSDAMGAIFVFQSASKKHKLCRELRVLASS